MLVQSDSDRDCHEGKITSPGGLANVAQFKPGLEKLIPQVLIPGLRYFVPALKVVDFMRS